jgi:class 3 adenylate cyclase/ligand-binding sensor domain-containing protein
MEPSRRLVATMFTDIIGRIGKWVFLGYFLIGFWCSLRSQEPDFQFEHISIEEGLPHVNITYLAQDQKGFMWFATWGGGLIRFDGYEYKQYLPEEGNNQSISSRNLNGIVSDTSGNLWIVVEGFKLNRFDQKKEQFQRYDLNGVVTVKSGDEGQIYIGGSFGLVKLEGNNQFDTLWNHKSFALGQDSVVRAILPISGNEIWFATYDGIARMNLETRVMQFNPFPSSFTGWFVSLVMDQEGFLWIGSESDGLFRYDPINGLFVEHIYQKSLKNPSRNLISNLFLDDNDRLFVSSNGNGLSVLYENFTRIKNFLPTNNYGSINGRITAEAYRDHQGNIWIGTFGHGINKINTSKNDFRYYEAFKGEGDGLLGQVISGMSESKDGKIWLGLDDISGLVLFDPSNEHFHVFNQNNGLIKNKVSSVSEDLLENIWVGSIMTGLSKYKLINDQLILIKNYPVVGSDVWRIYSDALGGLWIVVDSGSGPSLYKYEVDADSFIDIDIRVYAITSDSSGNLYVLSGGNLVRINQEILDREIVRQDVSGTSMLSDDHGNIWILGNHELLCYDLKSKKLESFGEGQGFPASSQSFNLLEDNQGNIWFTTIDGIYLFDRKTNQISKKRTDFRTTQNFDGILKTSSGLFYVADHNGMVIFHPDSMYHEERIVLPAITSFSISNKMVQIYDPADSTTLHSPLHQSIAYTEHMLLNHDENDVAFGFTAFEYSEPSQVQFRFKLENYNKDWIYTTADNRIANYTNLGSGNYNFRLQASLRDQWGDELTSMTIKISPPWWLTWWAKLLYALAVISSIIGYVRWRTGSLKSRQRELEKKVQERTAEVESEKQRSDEVLTNILPAEVAEELKETGRTQPMHFEEVSILFADFKEFTNIVASIPGKKLVSELDDIFQHFDDIMDSAGLEKIQTVGDAYVAAGGLPKELPDHAIKCVEAGKKMINFLKERNISSSIKWKLRVGIHSGPITAGVVGKRKFSYDVFGDTVNIAARIESASEEGRINVSAYSHDLIKDHFPCDYRGKINAKGKGDLDMYFVN